MAAERAPVLVRHGDGGGVEALRQLPPGFRFRPTDEELVVQYLRRKAFGVPLPAAVIPVVRDLYSLDPWDVVVPPAAGPDASSEGEKYFFAVRPAAGAGGKSGGGARATASGRWKPAGKEKPVVLPRPCGGGSLLVGVKRALTFVPRRNKKKASSSASASSSALASAALASGWVMHEYRLAAPLHKNVRGQTRGVGATRTARSPTGWYGTNQFSVDVIFGNRMKQYVCPTNDSSITLASCGLAGGCRSHRRGRSVVGCLLASSGVGVSLSLRWRWCPAGCLPAGASSSSYTAAEKDDASRPVSSRSIGVEK